MSGRTGKLFTEFAHARRRGDRVGFVALTLSPMMCSKLPRHEPTHGRIYNGIERFWPGSLAVIAQCSSWRRRALAGDAGVRGGGGELGLADGRLKSELAPLRTAVG